MWWGGGASEVTEYVARDVIRANNIMFDETEAWLAK
jgi:hypothetical protein